MKGFTLIELLLVIGITIILVAMASPIYSRLLLSSQINDKSAQIAQDIRLSREQSLSGLNNVSHGIKFFQHQYVMYQGESYLVRIQIDDRVVDVGSAIFLTTTLVSDEVNFTKGTGQHSNAGTITITHDAGGSKIVVINDLGIASEQ